MPSSGLPHALEGSLHEAPSDALFWIAAGLTLTLGLLLQRAPAESNRWKFVLQRFTHWEGTPSRLWIPNFLLVGVMSLLGLIILGGESIPHLLPGYHGPWYGLYLLPLIALSTQLIVHTLFGAIWEQSRNHWSHWGQRFSLLPALWIALPFFLWVLVSAQASQDLMEPFYVGIVILSLILYALGLLKALFRYVSTGHTPWYVAILYLCALETSPLFWVVFFQTYEG